MECPVNPTQTRAQHQNVLGYGKVLVKVGKHYDSEQTGCKFNESNVRKPSGRVMSVLTEPQNRGNLITVYLLDDTHHLKIKIIIKSIYREPCD
ncbi:hypothetical protein EWB00_006011 [Schistosoma japonicum]|uniref:Uncharacterized protein n=1 Tax=Schistosoma japonicum TaxID=6182 RepID=A0A4Z2DTR3_SCHJA|nr:hypothetical protein EWB00_006011 [Schistosoma japonicum]